MPAKSRKQALREFLAAGEITAIGEEEWQAALRLLAPISESYLRDLLRQTGLPFAQPYAGIRYCRRQAIAAKDRARFAAHSPKTSPEKKAQKEEMVQWMLVWLENPEVFPAWVDIRKRYCSSTAST